MANNPRKGDRLADLVLSTNAIEDAPPTPPYRQYPSSLTADSTDAQSPPYRSRSQVFMMDENEKLHTPDEKPSVDAEDTKPAHPKATVHYPDDVSPNGGHGYSSKPVRFDSPDLPSRAPSLAPSDDDFNEDDYDWSTEDDLVDEEAKKFEKQMGVKQKRSGCMRVITFFLSTLVGSVITAGVIVAAALLVHFLYYERSNDDNRAQRRYVTQNVEAWLFWAAANLLISWFLAFIINIIPGVVSWAIFIVWGHLSESMKSRVEFYNSVKDTIKPVFYGASGWLSWVILFEHIFVLYNHGDESASLAPYTPRVYQAIEFLFFFVLVLSVQKMFSHMIAFAFHKTAFKDRLTELKLALKTIDHLKNYRPKHRPERSSKLFSGFAFGGHRSTPSTPFDEKSQFMFHSSRVGTPDPYDDGHAGDSEDNSTAKKGKGKQKRSHSHSHSHSRVKTVSGSVSPAGSSRPNSPANALSGQLVTSSNGDHTYPPKGSPIEGSRPVTPSRPMTPARRNSNASDELAVVQAGKALKKAILHDARNMTGNADEEGEGVLGWTVGSTQEAKKLARSIYVAFKTDKRRKYLVVEDFYPAYPNHDEALEAFRVFDTDHNGDISRIEIKQTLVKTYRERRFLSRSMRDVGQALRSLDHVLLAFAFVILFFISLSVFGVNVGTSLSSVYSLGIAASFIFKNTAKNMFDAIMFLFVTHPYDTGDRCFIDEENLVVKKMNLFATIFTRADGSETYYFNSQLFSKFITNARRSEKTAELCTLFVAWRTPLEKLDALEKCLNDWLATEENRWFEPTTGITLQNISFQRYLEITIGIPHNTNWQDWGLRNARKTAFYAAATYYCRQLGITYSHSPMPISWVGVDDTEMPASPTTSAMNDIDEPMRQDTSDMKPMLGFLPPADKRSSQLLRARKSKTGKKGNFRANDG